MRKLFIFLTITIASLISAPFAFADGPSDTPAPMNEYVQSPVRYVNLGDILNALFKYVPLLIGFVLFVYLLIGGITILTSGPDEQKKALGVKILTNAIIGTVIVVLSVTIVVFLQAILGQKIIFGL